MKALIFKEWREHLKWAPLPGLAILLMFLMNKPGEPMPDVTVAFFLCLTGVLFGTALGFLQVFFEGHGDPRSLLFHRPLYPSRVFLAKEIAGMSLYLLALGIPFVCIETWKARPGNLLAPYHWRTSLPWLADILSGLVYYFAGMLTAQRDVRWYGSRGLALAAAFFCSFLVWVLPEFWQALLAIAIIGLLVSLAAWGSICAGGAYAPQPRFAQAALAMTFLAGLLIVSMFGKQMIGAWFDSGFCWEWIIDRQGREVAIPYAMGRGPIGPWTDLEGHELPDLNRSVDLPRLAAPASYMEAPLFSSYRNSGRFYVECRNETKPGNERWYYDQAQGRLVGRHLYYHHLLGSFGPDGFTPPGAQPGQGFEGELRYENNRWYTFNIQFLAFPGRVYTVDFARRTIRALFTPSAGETVVSAGECEDFLTKDEWFVVGTEKSFHFLTEEGSPMVSVPRAHDCYGYLPGLGKLEKPERYFAWYQPNPGARFVEPQESKTAPFHLHEYDAGGRELTHRDHPQRPYPAASYAKAFFGLVTPMTEVATLVRLSKSLRSEGRSQRSTRQPVILDYLENMRYFVPGTSRFERTPGGLIPGYVALLLLSAAASALGCFVLARRSAFSRARRIGWALLGLVFGWVGLVLMLVLQEWPARVSCPECRQLRVVTRETCEHCGALHASPAADGTEIFEQTELAALAAR
jgi:hypothetical protein